MFVYQGDRVIGKYIVECGEHYGKGGVRMRIKTDNPLEAVWEANKFPDRSIINVCGEREIYQENGKWKVRKS